MTLSFFLMTLNDTFVAFCIPWDMKMQNQLLRI